MKTILEGITTIFQHGEQTCVFLAPAGLGKTTLTIEYFQTNQKSIVFISPLRALAQELSDRLHSINIKNYCPINFQQAKLDILTIQKRQLPFFFIATPETFDDNWWSLNFFTQHKILVVIDECHLFFYWGDSFRPRLLEFLENLASTPHNQLFLTATLAASLKIRINELLQHQRQHIYIIDIGNQKILRPPKYIRYLPQKLIPAIIHRHLDSSQDKNCVIIFCRFRNEVIIWEKHLTSFGLQVLSCLGGESVAFREKLLRAPHPQVIIATSVLGHGVNLPPCSLVVLTYHEENPDLALQMLARGGRKGEDYWCLKPIIMGHFFIEKKFKLGIFWTCVRDLYQCTLAIVYGWLFYPPPSINDVRADQNRRANPQKNTLSGKALASDSAFAPRDAKNCIILWWQRWWQTAKRIRFRAGSHDQLPPHSFKQYKIGKS